MHGAHAGPLYSSILNLQTIHPYPKHRNTSALPPSTIPSSLPLTSPPLLLSSLLLSSLLLSSHFRFLFYPLTSVLPAFLIISLEREVSQFRAWMNLKLSFHFPALFKIIFDSEAMSAYERLFTTIMKVCIEALDVLMKYCT
jgi:hypothetical protein